MTNFLDLPQELRDEILLYVITTPWTSPTPLNQTFHALISGYVEYEDPTWPASQSVLYRPRTTLSNAEALLMVNKQLRAETQHLLNIFFQNNCEYDLDIIVLDEIILLASWQCVPMLTRHVRKLNVTFRITGAYDRKKEVGVCSRCGGLAWGPKLRLVWYRGFKYLRSFGEAIGWQVFSILKTFMQVGPQGGLSNRRKSFQFIVDTLSINIQTPRHIDPTRFGPPRSANVVFAVRPSTLRQPDVLNPDFLTCWLRLCILHVLRDGTPKGFRKAKVLIEHVNDVVISQDGKVVGQIDIGNNLKVLETVSLHDPVYFRLSDIVNGMLAVRKARGLRTL